MDKNSKNVFGEPLKPCNNDPVTGFYRTGCCDTGDEDRGEHTVCAIMTDEFLAFSKQKGNDLSTPIPQFGFSGLKAGDRWCLCVLRWLEAYDAGMAPQVLLEATNEKALKKADMDQLLEYAFTSEIVD